MPEEDRTLRREDGFGGEADAFYEALLEAHEGLSDPESAALDARLVLILANEVGDLGVLRQALAAARASLGSTVPAVIPGLAKREPGTHKR